MNKILVIQTAFIGDAILATALLEKLNDFYPEADIDFLVRKGNEGLFKDHPFLHNLLIWDKKHGKYKELMKLLWRIRNHKYDIVVNAQRFAATGMLTALSGASYTIGFDKNPWSFMFTQRVPHEIRKKAPSLHEVERNQLLIKTLTDNEPAKPRLYPNQAMKRSVAAYQNAPYICVAPASVWFTKQFPAEKWVAFLDNIQDSYKVYLLGGKEDEKLCEQIRSQSKHRNVESLAGKLGLLQSAALMAKAVMNYVNDSAPMHLASATNSPVTAVYCSTVPAFGFGPLSDKHFIIETKEKLDCRPCGLHGFKSCPLSHFKCAETIEVSRLTATLGA